MTRKLLSIGSLLTLGVLLTLLNISGSSGCSSGGASGAGTTTSQDAESLSNATTLAGIQVINLALGGGAALEVLNDSDTAAALLKNSITANSTGSCSARSLPSLSSGASSMTISGSQFTCQGESGSGSCAVSHQETNFSSSTTGKAILNCSHLVVPVQGSGSSTTCVRVDLNGRFGIDYTESASGSDTTFDIDFSSGSLTEGNLNCDIHLNYSTHLTSDTSGNGTVSANGCVSECGDAFILNGSDNL